MITLAVVPSTTPGDRRAALDDVCRALGAILRTEVDGVTPESYEELTELFVRDEVQYAWVSPAQLVLAEQQIRLAPVVSAVRGDRTEYHGALFVPAESPAREITQLAGGRVAWVDATSASGYLYPRLQLAARGLDPSRLFGEELFLRSHAEVVRAVFSGRADVGATYSEWPRPGHLGELRSGFRDVAPERPARVLEWTSAIPNDLIAGHGLRSRAELRQFGDAVLALAAREDGRALLYRAFHAERFVVTPRGALGKLRDLVEHAREHGLLTQL